FEVLSKTRSVETPAYSAKATYPQIRGPFPDSILSKTNEFLAERGEVSFETPSSMKEELLGLDLDVSVVSDYRVLFENDSLLSFEIWTIKTHLNSIADTSYYPLVLNKSDLRWYVVPEALFPQFDRELLRPFLPFGEKHFHKESYETGANSGISWCLAEDAFILYPGGEGEFFGKFRVEIPIEELMLNEE
ncbi:MAG: hypothetical protein GYB31_21215, partial [Bacteroidetes bacterium]|nr:hypothetical protein [Bacteroidota bacterium]